MDFQQTTLLGYATSGQIPHKSNIGFRVFEKTGIFDKLENDNLKLLLQLPRGLEIQPNSEIISLERLYTNDGKNYLIFFVEYGFAANEDIIGGRPCYYAGAVGYIFKGQNPKVRELLSLLHQVSESAKQKTLNLSDNIGEINFPSLFQSQPNQYKYPSPDDTMKGYFYLPNIENQKFSFIELVYDKNFDNYQRIFGISSKSIIRRIKDKKITYLGTLHSQSDELIKGNDYEKPLNNTSTQISNQDIYKQEKSDVYRENLASLYKENHNLKQDNVSLQEELKDVSTSMEKQNEIIQQLQIQINQIKTKNNDRKSSLNIFSVTHKKITYVFLTIISLIIIGLFLRHNINLPISESGDSQNSDLMDSINILNRNENNQLIENNISLDNIREEVEERDNEIAKLKQQIELQNTEILSLNKKLRDKEVIQQQIYHQVVGGEGLIMIAERYGVSVGDIIKLNPQVIGADSSIKEGAKLLIK